MYICVLLCVSLKLLRSFLHESTTMLNIKCCLRFHFNSNCITRLVIYAFFLNIVLTRFLLSNWILKWKSKQKQMVNQIKKCYQRYCLTELNCHIAPVITNAMARCLFPSATTFSAQFKRTRHTFWSLWHLNLRRMWHVKSREFDSNWA